MLRRIFYSRDSEFQIGLRGCAGSYGYSLLSCGVRTAVMFRGTFFKQTVNSRSGYADAQAHMGIRCSHVA